MSSVYYLTLRQLTGRWRLFIMTVLAAMPVVIAQMVVVSDRAPAVEEFEMTILGAMFTGSILPLIVLAIAAAAFSNELEDRTLANLTLAPLPRWQIIIPKVLGSVTIAAPFILVSAFATSYVAYLGDPVAVTAMTVAALICVLLYSAAFTWLGLVTTQAIGIGLLYIVLWEGFFSGFVSGVRLLSIRHYAIAVMHGLDPRRFAVTDHLSLPAAVATSAILFALFVFMAIRRLQRMDVP
jgi:ABC-2 type transport system permease protein